MSDLDEAELLAKQEKEERKRKRKEHQEAVTAGRAVKVKKALPDGYVCKICGAKNAHAVYDCPKNEKKTKGKEKDGTAAAAAAEAEAAQQPTKKKAKTEKATKKKSKKSRKAGSDSSSSSSSSSDEEEEEDNNHDITDDSNAAGRAAFMKLAGEAGAGTGAANDNIAGGYISSAQKQVYMSGLPFDMTVGKLLALLKERQLDADLKQPFGVHLVSFADKPGKCKGVAFVTFNNLKAALACCAALDGVDLPKADGTPGKTLRCEVNNRKQEKEWKPPDLSLAPKGIVYKANNKVINGQPMVKRCYRCGSTEHEPKDCHNDRVCYRCRSTDHISTECPMRKNSGAGAGAGAGGARAYPGYADRTTSSGATAAVRRPGGVAPRPASGTVINKATGKGLLPAPTGKKIVFED